VFNWEYASDPATAATTIGNYRDAKVEKLDALTVRVRFERPTPFWANPFVAGGGMIIPKHRFEPYKGANSRDAPANLKPVGTGPYRFVEFKPGDLVRGERNPSYHVADRPYFDTIEMKGGGDAVSAARAVIQDRRIRLCLEQASRGRDPRQTRKCWQRQGSCGDCAEQGDRAHAAQPHRSVDRGRRRALEP
jgi:MarR-like DNA-binding transcriptional regulator SgrR of sgrS sRNA